MRASTLRRAPTPRSNDRWSFVLQDVPTRFINALCDIDKGYFTRVALVFGGFGTVIYGGYCLVSRKQETWPLAQRWSWCTPLVPVTLIERRKVDNSHVEVFRFSLPNPADYAGYEPVSSVKLHSGPVKGFSNLSRWFTPISHPQERGVIEFAIKDQEPGRMASRLQYLKVGDTLYLGRWMKEFPYKPNAYKEIGLICSTGGISVAMQLAKVMSSNPKDETKLSILACHQSAMKIPFEPELDEYEKRFPKRFRVMHNVMTTAGRRIDFDSGKFFLGNVDYDTITKSMPPPVLVPSPNAEDSTATSASPVRSEILVCGPVSLMTHVCGRGTPIGNYTYLSKGLPYKFSGILKDLGYERKQVYKFGVSTHILAYHY